MIERGIVTKREGSALTVRLEMSDHCEGCAAGQACSSGKNEIDVWDRNGVDPAVGDSVEVLVTTRQQLEGAVLLVLVPVVLFFAGYGAGHLLFLGLGEGPAIAGGVIGILAGLLVATLVDRGRKREAMPYVLRKVVAVDGTVPDEEYNQP